MSRIGVALVATTLVGASAFAESRPRNETRGNRREGGRIERGSSGERSSASRRDHSSNASREREANSERRWQRDTRDEVRSEQSSRNSERDRSYRDNNRYNNDRSNRQWRDRGSYDRSRGYDRSRSYRQPYYGYGRISQVHRYGSGYRIWIVGTPYPFYIPLAYYRHDRFRVGLSINLGGYYNDGGYYDYYDGYSDGYYDNRSDGAIRGVVESVDYRDDSFVVRNDATGSFVTVLSRDCRRLDVRAGDYVELSGEWTRSGVFTAWDVDFLDNDYRR